jgi:ergothioneine biosynthesis protein EgtB
MKDARRLCGDALAAALRESRATLLSRVDDIDEARWRVPKQAGVNPIAWELAHVAWFAEFWVLRGPHRRSADGLVHAARPPHIAGPDEILDSARLPHAERWSAPLPSRLAVRVMLDEQIEACIAAIPGGEDDAALYAHRLSLFHEDMHGEALAWLRAALAWPAPHGAALPSVAPRAPVRMAGGPVHVGWGAGRRGFAFDNEAPGRDVVLAPFEIDAAPVTSGQFLRFVRAAGYEDPAWWPGTAGAWRAGHAVPHPARWRRAGDGWEVRWFDRWEPLEPDRPVIHVSAHEAQAYARWAGRRLPTAAEWEAAARSAGIAWGGSVWEWTADAFEPYPGFAPGPYADYSAPWFGDHRELRGGSFATAPRLHDPCYRNFFQPDRTDVFAGFRTAL